VPTVTWPLNEPGLQQLDARITALLPRAVQELAELVSIPSVADARLVDPAECRRAAEWVKRAFRAEGIPTGLERTPDGSFAVIGHRPGPIGSPTVLLYSHYDVQPVIDEAEWTSPPFELTEREGRLFARGSADSKGNIVAQLAALRAIRGDRSPRHPAAYPVGLLLVIEGSEEQGTAGLDRYVLQHPEMFECADVVLIQDAGNIAHGVPTLTASLRGTVDVTVRVRALESAVHSGKFGGAAPDAIAALVRMLATLKDERGSLCVPGIRADQLWHGAERDDAEFRREAGMLPGTELLGQGGISDQLWARPALTIVGLDVPDTVGATAAVSAQASARLNLRVAPGEDPAQLRDALIEHLHAVAPWGVQVEAEADEVGHPFSGDVNRPAFALLRECLGEAYDGAGVAVTGMGASIPLTSVLAEVNPHAEMLLFGVLDSASRIHSSDESVHPEELRRIALGEALFLSRLGVPGTLQSI